MDDLAITYLKSAEESLLWAEEANKKCFTDNERARVLESLLMDIREKRRMFKINTVTGRRKLT